MLYESLQYILQVCREHQQQRVEQVTGTTKGKQRRALSSQGSEEENIADDDGKIFIISMIKTLGGPKLRQSVSHKYA